jgi:uncharacterized protein with HEPN domain
MRPESRASLWDAHRAAELIRTFVDGEQWSDYVENAMLRSAVERQFEIVGEALNRLAQVDADTAARIDDLRRIVAFRNVLIHGYATIDDAIVWEVATERLPSLIDLLASLLENGELTEVRATRSDDSAPLTGRGRAAYQTRTDARCS